MGAIREPAPGDARRLGEIHVRAWQRAYRGGLMPDSYLDALSIDERSRMWSDALDRAPRARSTRLVATDGDDRVVGFITVGPAAGGPTSEQGEVYALNVDPDAWGGGHGRALLDAGTRALAGVGFRIGVLWVHPDNERACRFYERAGWHRDGEERREEVLGVDVPEVRYRRPLPEVAQV